MFYVNVKSYFRSKFAIVYSTATNVPIVFSILLIIFGHMALRDHDEEEDRWMVSPR